MSGIQFTKNFHKESSDYFYITMQLTFYLYHLCRDAKIVFVSDELLVRIFAYYAF